MKTKEIEVWVSNAIAKGSDGIHHICKRYDHEGETFREAFTKAKLVISKPERKATISESQLRDCFDSFRYLDDDHERRLVYSFYEFAKEKLFGSERGEG